jgi:hypothetical protein
MARLDFNWSEPTLNTYDKINTEDFFTALPEEFKTTGKPLMVFVTSEKNDDRQKMANIDTSVLRDESVSIGATMFRSVKIRGEKLKDSHPFWKTIGGKDLPRIIIVGVDGQKVGMMEGQDISSSKLFGLMKKAASKIYKTDLEAIVKETKTILTEIDQIEAKRTALQTKKASDKSERADKWAKEERELNDAMKAVETREAALKKKWEEKKVAKS